MDRVVFCENTERDKWSRLESLLQDIAAHQPSDTSIVPGGAASDPQESASNRSGVVAPSSHPRGNRFIAGGRMAAHREEAFIDLGISDSEADDSFRQAENFSMSTVGAR